MALTYTKNRWNNDDGLVVYFPDAAGTPTRGGELGHFDGHVSEVFITLADLPVLSGDANGLLLADNVRIPAGAFIEKVEVFVTKETAGSGANLNVGVVRADTMAIVDADGILAAADAFNSGTDLGGTTVYTRDAGSVTTEGGALIGTRLTYTSLLCAAYDTAAFTDGVVRVRVFWTPALPANV